MRYHMSRNTTGFTQWGVFHNLSPVTDRADRAICGWYIHLHTPWFRLELSA